MSVLKSFKMLYNTIKDCIVNYYNFIITYNKEVKATSTFIAENKTRLLKLVEELEQVNNTEESG